MRRFITKPIRFTTAGQTLIEVVIAMGISVLILVTLVSGVTVSLRNIQFANNKAQATKYAQEAFEAVRTIRDRDWELITNGEHGLVWNETETQWDFAEGSDATGQLRRVVTITDGGTSNSKNVTVVVSWREGSEIKNVTLYTVVVKL